MYSKQVGTFQEKVDSRKRILDRLIKNFKDTYNGKIIEAYQWEIRFIVMSKFNKSLALTDTNEKPKSIPQHETIKLIRPLAEYSNKGYLSLTGS